MITTGFGAFDQLAGLAPRGAYLLHGNSDSGKTAFALSFLAQGLEDGETVALVTNRTSTAIIDQARHLGLDLAGALRSGRLALFEYPAGVAASASRLLDDTQIVVELHQAMAHLPLKRLVLDPVTPLLAGQSTEAAAARFRTLVTAFGELRATTLYLVNTDPYAVFASLTPTDAGSGVDLLGCGTKWMASAAAMVTGAMRTEALALGLHRLTLERWDGALSGSAVDFELVEGMGLTSPGAALQGLASRNAPMAASPKGSATDPLCLTQGAGREKSSRPSVLIIAPVSTVTGESAGARRQPPVEDLSRLLGVRYEVSVALGAGHGIALVAETQPDAVLLLEDGAGPALGALAQRLRQAGHNMPILATGGRSHRDADFAALLADGVDMFLREPLHGRVLLLQLDNLFRRTGRMHQTRPEGLFPPPPARPTVGCTTQLGYFSDRIDQEQVYNHEYGLPTLVFAIRLSEDAGPAAVDRLAAQAALVLDRTDLVLIGRLGVAVLLTDAASPEMFLERFARSANGQPEPFLELLPAAESTSAAAAVWLARKLGLSESPVARRSKSASGGQAPSKLLDASPLGSAIPAGRA